MNRIVLLRWVAFLVVMMMGSSLLLAQDTAASPAPMDRGSMMSDDQRSGMHGMMHGRDGMGGMMGMCPMMSGGMGMGMMMGMMILMSLFWIAAIFALFSLGLFLLRRSREPRAHVSA